MKRIVLLSLVLILCILPFVAADYQEFAPGNPPAGYASALSDSSSFDGMIIHVGASPFKLLNVTVHPSSDFTKVYVYRDNAGTGVAIANASVNAGKNATFTVQLNANTDYLIVGGSDAVGWNSFANLSKQGYPVNFTNNVAHAWKNGTEIDRTTLAISYFDTARSIVSIQTNDTTAASLMVTQLTPLNNTSILTSSIFFNATLTPIATNITNATIQVWFSNGTLFNQTTNVVTGNVANTTNWTIPGFSIPATYKWNVVGCITNSSCFTAVSNFTFTWDGIVNSNVYRTPTNELATESYLTNTTVPPTLTLTSAIFNWNGTRSAGAFFSDGTNYILSKTFIIPTGTGTKNWFWELYFNDGSNFNLTNNQQVVNALSLDDCSSFTVLLLNYTMNDEVARTKLVNPAANTTFEISVQISDIGQTASTNVSLNKSGVNPVTICIQNLNATYRLDATARYAATGYVSELYSIQNYTLTNTTRPINVSLYDLTTVLSQQFKVVVKDKFFNLLSNAIVEVTRQYLPLNQFLVVEAPLSDSNGQASVHLDLNAVYTINVKSQGQLIATFQNVYPFCNNAAIGDCEIDLSQPGSTTAVTDFTHRTGVIYYNAYNETTRTYSMQFNVDNGTSQLFNLTLVKFDSNLSTTLCSQSTVASSGTLLCVIPTSAGNGTVQATGYVGTRALFTDIFDLRNIHPQLSSGRYILAALLVLTIPLLFYTSGPMMLIMLVVGIIIAGSLALLDFPGYVGALSAFGWIVLAAIAVLLKMGDNG